MKRITLALAVLVSLAFVAAAHADGTVPFPSNQVKGVFVAAQTVTAAGAVSDQFAIFGAFGAITFAALSGVLLHVLLPPGPAPAHQSQTDPAHPAVADLR